MRAQQRWHRLSLFQEPRLCSEDKLHALLTRELGYNSRHKFHCQRKGWALGLLTFVVAIATAVEVTSGSKFDFLFTLPSKSDPLELIERIEDRRYIQVAELAMFDPAQIKNLVAGNHSVMNLRSAFALDPSAIGADLSWEPTSTALPPHYIRPTRAALSPEARREVEFWRVVAYWNDPTLYESYLRYYPAGTFTHIAQSKGPRGLPKATSVAQKKKTKPLAAGTDQTTLATPALVNMERQCRDERNRCAPPSKAEKNDCSENYATSNCVKRNYRALERTTTAIRSQRHRQ